MSNLMWYPGHDLLLDNIVRAENCHIFDERGNKYVDLESGVWCTSVGHGRKRVLLKMAEQASLIAHAGFNYSNEAVEEAAKRVMSLLGFEGGKCVFLCSGSEAVEYGVRVAQLTCTRPLLMTMADSYFGAYGSANARREDEWYSFDWSSCAYCPDEKDCDASCESWRAIPFAEIGGFLFEPGSSSGLVRFPPTKLVRAIVRAVKDVDGLVLVNEVTTGIGRTGAWFGFQHYGISPDIVAMGKGVGNGYPVSVTAFSPGAVRRLGDKQVNYAQSHQNDPLGAAIAAEVIKMIQEEKLIERGGEIADTLVAGLEGIKTRTGMIAEVRARGLMLALELKGDPQGSFAAWVQRELLRKGFLLARRPGVNVLRMDPSLTIDRADIERFLEALENVLGSATGERS